MAKNKFNPGIFNSAEWLASCGFIFPSTETELKRFNARYGLADPSITGEQVDPLDIIARSRSDVDKLTHRIIKPFSIRRQYQMVARKKK